MTNIRETDAFHPSERAPFPSTLSPSMLRYPRPDVVSLNMMLSMKTILVPTDFSAEATHALEVAAGLTRKTGAHLQILHVVDILPQPSFAVTGEYQPGDPMERLFVLKQIERAQEALLEMQEAQYRDIPVKCLVKAGEVYPVIAQHLKDEKIDLIVMGTTGAGLIEDLLVGSNTEKVVRRAKCLVLTVQKPAKDFKLENVLIPTDFETTSSHFFRELAELQPHFSFRVHLLYVNTPLNFSTTAKIEARRNQFIKHLPLQNVTYAIVNDYAPEDSIRSLVRTGAYDLVAMLTHQRKGLSHFLEGSITEEVLHQNQVPLLTYGCA